VQLRVQYTRYTHPCPSMYASYMTRERVGFTDTRPPVVLHEWGDTRRHTPHRMYRASLIGPVFMVGCMSVFYLYNISKVMSWTPRIRVLRGRLNVDVERVPAATPPPLWVSEPLPVVLQTRAGASRSRPALSRQVSVVLDSTTNFNSVGQVDDLVRFAPPHMNLNVYVGVAENLGNRRTQLFRDALHNSSVPVDTAVDLVALGIAPGMKQQDRVYRMVWHALHEMKGEGVVLVLHNSCTISSWDVATLEAHGNGFMVLHKDTPLRAIYHDVASHDLGLSSGSLVTHRRSYRNSHETPFHCSGGMMHALHVPRRTITPT
jgi:hypothetical protein